MNQSIGDIVGILADNLALRKSVMPLSAKQSTAWAKGLNIPHGGTCVLYTGHMYQLLPYISTMQKQTEMVRSTPLVHTFWIGRLINKFINTTWFMARADAKQKKIYNRRLRNIALLLRKANVDFGYLYGKELYAGALVSDLGGKDILEAHARRVYAMLKSEGVKSIITVDPHTTDMLKDMYATIIPDYDIEVKSYLEVLAEKDMIPCKKNEGELAIHDSCVYARYMNTIEQPRKLLANAGITVKEPAQTGKFTQCCGGPVEALYPEKARKFAKERLEQLKATGCKEAVAMCPICLQNLEHAAETEDITIRDISECLYEAYCDDPS
ncbi:MAG: (Fe-S)-binding protein [Candidatus Hydrogenedentes bacterium]|nr:(Fe-S)-binding protein [Candidatus Hydrogenedentota bacterium]